MTLFRSHILKYIGKVVSFGPITVPSLGFAAAPPAHPASSAPPVPLLSARPILFIMR